MSENLPSVSFVLPVRNGEALIGKCLETITAQDYPKDLLQIIVTDGGSKDNTREICESLGAEVIDNPEQLAEPGVHLGFQHASGDIVFVMAADNGLPRTDWVRLMVKPFVERENVIGSYTQIIPSPEDNAFTRYYCKLHVEPFTWFVYGAGANPRDFAGAYKSEIEGDGYTVFDFPLLEHPLIAMAQGFGVRKTFERREGYEQDDILPIIQMVEDGQELAYVPEAGVYHHHLTGFIQYCKKYTWRIRNSLYARDVGFDCRQKYMTKWRVAKKYLFGIYGLTMILPLIDSLRLWLKEKDACMLWHGPATVALCWIIVIQYAKKGFCVIAAGRPR